MKKIFGLAILASMVMFAACDDSSSGTSAPAPGSSSAAAGNSSAAAVASSSSTASETTISSSNSASAAGCLWQDDTTGETICMTAIAVKTLCESMTGDGVTATFKANGCDTNAVVTCKDADLGTVYMYYDGATCADLDGEE